MPADRIRAFVALEVSDAVRHELAVRQRWLRDRLPDCDVRWARLDQGHLTLRFLGDVPREDLAQLNQRLTEAFVGKPTLKLELSGWGAFPSLQRPRVIWCGVGGDLTRLAELWQACQQACAGIGEAAEEHAFHPHLTLGRIARPGPAVSRALLSAMNQRQQESLVAWVVPRVCLFRSRLEPSGAVHAVLADWRLAEIEVPAPVQA